MSPLSDVKCTLRHQVNRYPFITKVHSVSIKGVGNRGEGERNGMRPVKAFVFKKFEDVGLTIIF